MTVDARASPANGASLGEVRAAVGRNVLLYQHLEHLLKVLLPFVRTEDKSLGDDPFSEMKQLLESKRTMGLLIGRLKTSVQAANPEEFRGYLKQVVDNRNELVHAFVRLEFGCLDTEEARTQALSYLRARYDFATPLLTMLRELLATFGQLLANDDAESRRIQKSFAVRIPPLPRRRARAKPRARSSVPVVLRAPALDHGKRSASR